MMLANRCRALLLVAGIGHRTAFPTCGAGWRDWRLQTWRYNHVGCQPEALARWDVSFLGTIGKRPALRTTLPVFADALASLSFPGT